MTVVSKSTEASNCMHHGDGKYRGDRQSLYCQSLGGMLLNTRPRGFLREEKHWKRRCSKLTSRVEVVFTGSSDNNGDATSFSGEDTKVIVESI